MAQRAASAPEEANPVPILQINNLGLAHRARPLIHVSHMDVQSGEVLAIIGRSGCGKTTLLSCLSGHFPIASGEFFLAGKLRGRDLPRTFVSRTLQGAPLLHWLSVKGNLRLAARIRKVIQPDYDAILASFAAETLAHRYPATLSGGERCRASLSQALLGNPRLLLLDEPFTGLDSIVKQFVAGNLFRLARASNAGIIFVTHDLHDAVEFSDRVIVIGGSQPATVVSEVMASDPQAVEVIRDFLERYR